MTMLTTLQRLHERLLSQPGKDTAGLAAVIVCCAHDEGRCDRALTPKRMWGDTGSVANKAPAGIRAWPHGPGSPGSAC